MPQGLVKPANGILYAGQPVVTEYEVKTATSMYPGRLVITDTNEWNIKVATSGAATVLGVLDVEPGQLRTTLYDDGDQARVLSGDIVVLLTKDADLAITIGQKVIPANSGMVQVTGAADVNAVGYALQAAVAASATLLVKLTI